MKIWKNAGFVAILLLLIASFPLSYVGLGRAMSNPDYGIVNVLNGSNSTTPSDPASAITQSQGASLDREDLFSRATHALKGIIGDVTSFWNEDRSMIYTDATVVPSDWLKGVFDSGPVIVRTGGGQVEDVGMSVHGEPTFEKGEEVILYLVHHDGDLFSVVDAPGGKTAILSPSGVSPLSGFGDPSGNAQGYRYDGKKWATSGDVINYYINQNGTPDDDNEVSAVTAAFQTWEADLGSTVDFNYQGLVATGAGHDLTSVVVWVSSIPCPFPPCTENLAVADWYLNDVTGNLDEVDIRINDRYVWTDSGEAGKNDIQNVVTHEVGHFLWLDDLQNAGDSDMTMYYFTPPNTTEIKKRTLEWGDIAGLRFIYPNTVTVPGWFGDQTQDGDVALRDINKDGVLDVVALWVDNPGGANTIYYRVGWNIDNNGYVGTWTAQKAVGGSDGVGSETSGAGVVLSDINSNGVLDMLVFWIDNPTSDVMYYRIGWDINTSGDIGSWTLKKTVGGGNIGNDTSGGGATLVNLDSNVRPELVVTWIDNPSGANTMYYRIGWNLDTSGNTSSWSANKVASSSVGNDSDGAGVAPAVWLTDEFSETITRQWATQAGTWALESGELSGAGTSARIVSSKTFPSDRTFQVRFHAITAGPNSWYVPWLGGKYVDEYNRAIVVLHTTGLLELNVATGGSSTSYTVQTSLNVYDWHTAKTVFIGNNAKIYIDNVLYLDVNEPKIGTLCLAAGYCKVQLASWGTTHAHFDDVVVDDTVGKPDLVFHWVDDPFGANRMYYRVGWDVDTSGNAGSWSNTKWTPGIGGLAGGIGNDTQGGGVAIADINGNGFLEMIFLFVDDPSGGNSARYRVEWEGRVNSHPNF